MKNCPSYPGYSASDTGRVFTHRKRFGKGKGNGGGVRIDQSYCKELNQYIGHGGYYHVSVSTQKGQRSMPVHVMVADAFLGMRPEGQEVRHLDGTRVNNHLSNLCYGTPKENTMDRIIHGRSMSGTRNPRSILTEENVLIVRQMHQEGITIAEISRRLNVGESTVRDVVKGKTWRHVA